MTDRAQFMRKTCPTCKAELPPSAFNKRRTVAGNVVLASECRECHKQTAKDWRQKKALERTKKLPSVNPERKARRDKRRAKERRSPEERAARKAAWDRCKGMCECGCGYPFGDYVLDRPDWHHPSTTSYSTHQGIWVRKRCHERIEMRDFSYRHQRGRR